MAIKQTDVTDLSQGLMECSFLRKEGILGLFILTIGEKKSLRTPVF